MMGTPAAQSWLDFHKPTLTALAGSAAFAIITLLIAWRPWQHGRRSKAGSFGEGVAVAGGYLVGHVAVSGLPALRPTEAHLWLFHATALAVFPWFHAAARAPLRWALRSALVLSALFLMLEPYRQYTWGSAPVAAMWIVGLAAAWLAWWAGLDALTGRAAVPTAPIALLATSAGTGILLLVSGFFTGAQLAGGLTAALGASCVIAAWSRRRVLTGGGGAVCGVVFPGLWIVGHFFADATATTTALVAVAPLLALSTAFGPMRRLNPWPRSALALAATGITIIVALLIACRQD